MLVLHDNKALRLDMQFDCHSVEKRAGAVQRLIEAPILHDPVGHIHVRAGWQEQQPLRELFDVTGNIDIDLHLLSEARAPM